MTPIGMFYWRAWEFCAQWRPSGGLGGVSRALLTDLEVFMAEARLNARERSICREMVGTIDRAYVGESNRLLAAKK